MNYRIIRSRRKTISLEITPQGELFVRCPMGVTNREIQKLVASRQDWIDAHLAGLPLRQKDPPLTPEEILELSRYAKLQIPPRVECFAARLGVTYGRISIRTQRTRWGSCSAKGNLNFNCLLMLAPPEILDYVIVHELCHRKEMNHSPQFWAEVEAILPDYHVRRQWLRRSGNNLMARLPVLS